MFRINLIKYTSILALPLLCGGPSLANGIIGNPGRYDGGSLGVQTQTGTNCSSSAPDRPSVSAVAGTRNRDYYNGGNYSSSYNSDNNDLAAGIIVTVPFGGQKLGDCSALLEMEEQRARLDLAMTLFEAGAMTAEEIKVLAEEVKGVVDMPTVNTITEKQ